VRFLIIALIAFTSSYGAYDLNLKSGKFRDSLKLGFIDTTKNQLIVSNKGKIDTTTITWNPSTQILTVPNSIRFLTHYAGYNQLLFKNYSDSAIDTSRLEYDNVFGDLFIPSWLYFNPNSYNNTGILSRTTPGYDSMGIVLSACNGVDPARSSAIWLYGVDHDTSALRGALQLKTSYSGHMLSHSPFFDYYFGQSLSDPGFSFHPYTDGGLLIRGTGTGISNKKVAISGNGQAGKGVLFGDDTSHFRDKAIVFDSIPFVATVDDSGFTFIDGNKTLKRTAKANIVAGIGAASEYHGTAIGYVPYANTDTTFNESAITASATKAAVPKLYVGKDTSASYSYNSNAELVVKSEDWTSISIITPKTHYGDIAFGDTDAGLGRYSGRISYDHSVNDLSFSTKSLRRITIDSAGKFGIGDDTPDSTLTVNGSSNTTGNAKIGGHLNGISANLQSGLTTLLLGADTGATTLTDNTRKISRIVTQHYDIDEEPIGTISCYSSPTVTALNIGGNTGWGTDDGRNNSVTEFSISTASAINTLTGTKKFTIYKNDSAKFERLPIVVVDSAFKVRGATTANDNVTIDRNIGYAHVISDWYRTMGQGVLSLFAEIMSTGNGHELHSKDTNTVNNNGFSFWTRRTGQGADDSLRYRMAHSQFYSAADSNIFAGFIKTGDRASVKNYKKILIRTDIDSATWRSGTITNGMRGVLKIESHLVPDAGTLEELRYGSNEFSWYAGNIVYPLYVRRSNYAVNSIKVSYSSGKVCFYLDSISTKGNISTDNQFDISISATFPVKILSVKDTAQPVFSSGGLLNNIPYDSIGDVSGSNNSIVLLTGTGHLKYSSTASVNGDTLKGSMLKITNDANTGSLTTGIAYTDEINNSTTVSTQELSVLKINHGRFSSSNYLSPFYVETQDDVDVLTDGAATDLFNTSLGLIDTGMVSGTIDYTIYFRGAGEIQSHHGIVTFSQVKRGTNWLGDIDEVYLAANETHIESSGTITDAWSISNDLVRLNSNTSLTGTLYVAFTVTYRKTFSESVALD